MRTATSAPASSQTRKPPSRPRSGPAIPDGFNVAVHEDSATTAHLVLPPSPKLTEAELETVVGGTTWGGEKVFGKGGP